jgi:succinoglycan biosynthesis protein ExoU
MNCREVCVVIPAYNAQATIARAVNSALTQDYVQEVVVCDDASDDDTSSIARLQDDGTGRLSVITLPKNAGPAAARNVAFAASRSPYVCLLDSDDYFLPGRIARLLDAEIGEWDLLADDIIIVPEKLTGESGSLPAVEPARDSVALDLKSFVAANITRPGYPRGEWGFLKPLMRRAFLDEHGLRYDEALRLGEDYALYVQALIAGARFRITGPCGYVAIERDSSLSSQHSAADLKNIIDFDARCLAGASKLSAGERAALVAHRKATQKKCDYRTVLDIKKERGRLTAVAALLGVPSAWSHILGETFRVRVAALARRYGRQAAKEGQVRLLVGTALGTGIRSGAEGFAR